MARVERLLDTDPGAPGGGAFRQVVLDTGLRILVESCPIPYTVAAALWFEAGSRHDGLATHGLAHLVEHVILRRAAAQGQFGVELESMGADIDATTERELTGFSIRALREDLPRVLGLLYNLVRAPSFTASDVEKERAVVEQEIGLHEADGEAHVQELLAARMFAGTPLDHPIAGDAKTVRRLGLADVRGFMAQWYRPARATLVIAGDIDPARTAAAAAEVFARWAHPAAAGTDPASGAVPVTAALSGPAHVFKPRALQEVHLCAGARGLHRDDPDQVALYALSALLGEGMSSRLFLRARDREALAYSIYSYYNLFLETGCFAVYAATRPEAYAGALRLIAEEFAAIAAGAVAEDELALARAKLRRNLLFNMEHVELRATRVVKEAVWNGRYYTIPELVRQSDAITPHDVRRVAERLFSGMRLFVAGLGPLDAAVPGAVSLPGGARLDLLPA